MINLTTIRTRRDIKESFAAGETNRDSRVTLKVTAFFHGTGKNGTLESQLGHK